MKTGRNVMHYELGDNQDYEHEGERKETESRSAEASGQHEEAC